MKSGKTAAYFLIAAAAFLFPSSCVNRRREAPPPSSSSLSSSSSFSSAAARNYALIEPGESIDSIIRKAAAVVPSPRQWAWQAREFMGFIHFGINTFTGREWGDGTEDPALFNPADFDARQWVRVFKQAGMKTLILTAKHHDGFCLWPTAETAHGVKSGPWRGGRGDVVGEVAAACREAGLGFGFYLSPWDRHEPSYGDSPRYNTFFLAQLRELLTGYGPIAEVWFDGAPGDGPERKNQIYDWPAYYRTIRELQPEAVIAMMAPDARWVGTESGYGRETEWSVIPVDVRDPDAAAAASGLFPLDDVFVPRDLTAADLGSREKLAGARVLAWYPAETDVSIRPGWFYHASQDGDVKSPEKLLDIYESSVGRNGVLLLNVPPDRRGLIHENDEEALRELRRSLDAAYGTNLAAGAAVRASASATGHGPETMLDDDLNTFWTPPGEGGRAEITIDLPGPSEFDRFVLREHIRSGQRIESYVLEAGEGNAWRPVARGTTVGAMRILRFPAVSARRLRLVIEQSRAAPALASLGLHRVRTESGPR